MKVSKSQRVQVPNNEVLRFRVIVIMIQILGKYTVTRYLDFMETLADSANVDPQSCGWPSIEIGSTSSTSSLLLLPDKTERFCVRQVGLTLAELAAVGCLFSLLLPP